MQYFIRPRGRRGFTLVEMLVVIIIIALLTTMALVIGPNLGEKQRASRGAYQLQGWLFLAKQRALRDQKPRGLRMISDSTGAYVRQMQFIEQPDPLSGIIQFLIPLAPDAVVAQNSCYVVADLYPPPAGPTPPGTGDYTGLVNQPLAVDPTTGKFHYDVNDIMQIGTESFRIINVQPWLWNQIPPPAPNQSQPPIPTTPMPNDYGAGPGTVPAAYVGKSYRQLLQSTNPQRIGTVFRLDHYPQGHTMNDGDALQFVGKTFSIVRGPQPLPGEAMLDLPRDIAIDLSRCFPSGGSGGFLHDIMFAPSGKVIGQFAGFGRVSFWVRDVALWPVPNPTGSYSQGRPTDPAIFGFGAPPANCSPGGTHTLITVYTKTGKIAPAQVDPTLDPTGTKLADPFSFTRDGLSSGL